MAKRTRNPGGRPAVVSSELARQRAEGISRAYLEEHVELDLHETARSELHHLKAQAVATLATAMQNTARCPTCKETNVPVDKTAVTAALGVLDRAGLPPMREVTVKDARASLPDQDISRRAIAALVTLDVDEIGLIVLTLLEERPDARPALERAIGDRRLIEAASGV